MMRDNALIVLNTYSILNGPEAFETAIGALARRVAKDGEPGILSYQFFLDEDGATARAVIEYESAQAWIGHHDLAMNWPEMKALHAVARLAQVTFLGDVAQEIQDWIAASQLSAQITLGSRFVAGFRR